MVAMPHIGRKLTYKRLERRLRYRTLRQALQVETARPTSQSKPFYEIATTEEWIAAFMEWAESHRRLPPLPEQSYDRSYFYEDRS